MELTGFNADYSATGLIRMTLNCIGTDNDLATVQRVYNTGVYQLISLTGSGEKENKTMATTIRNHEGRNDYDIGYEKGYKNGNDAGFDLGVRTAKVRNTKEVFKIKKVIFNDPATIVFWADGTKTVAKAHGDDKFDKEVGLTVCIAKKALDNRSNFDKVFKKWIK